MHQNEADGTVVRLHHPLVDLHTETGIPNEILLTFEFETRDSDNFPDCPGTWEIRACKSPSGQCSRLIGRSVEKPPEMNVGTSCREIVKYLDFETV